MPTNFSVKNKINKFKHKHSLGQNFITDEFLLEDIADESGITKDDYVLEIGPGNGALTRCLCDRAKYVVAVEIDKTLIPLLKSNLKDYKNVSIINADFLNYDFQNIINEFQEAGANITNPTVATDIIRPVVRADITNPTVGADIIRPIVRADNTKTTIGADITNPTVGADIIRPIKVVANLPYYITSPIIQNLLQNPYISEMTLMVQKEVAERIVADPNTKDFGILTLACNYFADTEMIMIVSKDCFFPKPKVDSAVVYFKKHFPQTNYNDDNYEKLFKLIKASFAQRRKKLLNSLINAGYNSKEILISAFDKLHFDENVRAENLSLNDYKNLLTLLCSYSYNE